MGHLKSELTHAQPVVPITVEKVLDLSREVPVSCDDLQRYLTAAEENLKRGVEERGKLASELFDASLTLEWMEDWMRRVTDADKRATAAVSEVAEAKGEIGEVAENRNDFEGRWMEGEVEFDRRLIHLNNLLVKQAHIEKVLSGVLEQSVSVFDSFLNLLDGELVSLFRVASDKAYSDDLVGYGVSLTYVPGDGASSMSWRSDTEGEDESSPSSSKWRTGGKTPRLQGSGKS